MPKYLIALLLCLAPCAALALDTARDTWIVVVDLWGNPVYQTLELTQKDGALTGTLDGDAVTGRRDGSEIRFVATDAQQATAAYVGTIEGDTFAGTADMPIPTIPKRVRRMRSPRGGSRRGHRDRRGVTITRRRRIPTSSRRIARRC